MTSAAETHEDKCKAFNLGADQFLIKPIDSESL